MKHTWHNTPGSKQRWLSAVSSFGESRIIGMIYEVNPTRFALYKVILPNPC